MLKKSTHGWKSQLNYIHSITNLNYRLNEVTPQRTVALLPSFIKKEWHTAYEKTALLEPNTREKHKQTQR